MKQNSCICIWILAFYHHNSYKTPFLGTCIDLLTIGLN